MVTNTRITNTMITRRYMSNLNTSLGKLSESTGRISSGKQYSRLSENPLDVARSMRLEEDLSKNKQYVSVLEDAQSELASAESNLMSVVDVLTTAYERAIKAGTGTTSDSDREIIANEFDSYIEYIVKTMNATFNDKFLFSNTNNSDNAPFEVTDDGKVLFNGADVDDITLDASGNYVAYVRDDDGEIVYDDGDQIVTTINGGEYSMYTDGAGNDVYKNDTGDYFSMDADGNLVQIETTLTTDPNYVDPATFDEKLEQIPQTVIVAESATRYVDVGIGMSFDNNGQVIGATALEVSFSGLQSLGFGVDEDGFPNNVLSILIDLRDACYTEGEEFDLDHFGDVADKLIEVKDTCNTFITYIGTRSSYMQRSITRLESEEYNLESMKSILIEVDTADEIIAYKQYEFAWNAILQMGSKLIPTSLMDYVN